MKRLEDVMLLAGLVLHGGVSEGSNRIRERLLAVGVNPDTFTFEEIEDAIFFGLKRAFMQKKGRERVEQAEEDSWQNWLSANPFDGLGR